MGYQDKLSNIARQLGELGDKIGKGLDDLFPPSGDGVLPAFAGGGFDAELLRGTNLPKGSIDGRPNIITPDQINEPLPGYIERLMSDRLMMASSGGSEAEKGGSSGGKRARGGARERFHRRMDEAYKQLTPGKVYDRAGVIVPEGATGEWLAPACDPEEIYVFAEGAGLPRPVPTNLGIFYQTCWVSPETALNLLAKTGDGERLNIQNRSPNERHFKRLFKDMHAEKWALTHQGIAIGPPPDFKLQDGQHRLRAIVELDMQIPLTIAFNVSDEARMAIDIGRNRTVADYFQVILDQGFDKFIVPTMRRALLGNRSGNSELTQIEVIERISAHIQAVEFVARGFEKPKSNPGIRVGPVSGAVLSAIYTEPHLRLAEFMHILQSGDPAAIDEPTAAIQLRKQLQADQKKDGGKMNQVEKQMLAAKALKIFCKHEKVDGEIEVPHLNTEPYRMDYRPRLDSWERLKLTEQEVLRVRELTGREEAA